MKYKILASLILSLVFEVSFGQFDPEAKQALDAMRNNYQSIKAFTAKFSQNLTNEEAGFDEMIEGVITVKDDKYKLEISGQEIFNDGTDVWTYSPEVSEVTVSTYDPEDQEISLNNIWDLYQEGFKYILLASQQNGNKVIDLDPIDRDKSYFKIRMIISASNELVSFTVFEYDPIRKSPTGNKFNYSILGFNKRPELMDAFFTFDPDDYDGIDVVDFRY